ncbi:MAG TPA: fibronectin type III domain-containing protein, partial [Thermoanaerobaculia bacterium]|nr:fibronectin type III domain-containing protein [Thermoanaerobaculia bacterium]
HLLPVARLDGHFSDGFAPGNGRGLALVWQLTFRRRGETGTWRARVDATTGQLLELVDSNLYGKVNGGVYTLSPAVGSEVVLPMPFADLSTGGFTDAAGQFTFSGSPASSALNGRYIGIFDSCGSISQSTNAAGKIAFGASSGTDCTTPGSGGAGNTHSARTQFYQLNRVKQIGRGWLPGNTWLNAQLPANVNIPQVCNAYWDGYSVNFFRSGGGCGNTGEIAGVSVHEYGHGFDDNDGIPIVDSGTAESYADVTAALMLHNSCMGPGFFGTSNCDGYGDSCTSCSGVRDVDWAKHVSNTPHTVANFTQVRCGSGFGGGPCGGEGHCESYVPSEAIWDFAARDLPSPGTVAAWSVAERLWYLSRQTATTAFTCNTSGATWTSDGCNTGSMWRVMRLADDDDGNLANGTPHSCQLFAAFNRHGLACASDAGANVCFSQCTPPPVPSVTLTPGTGQIGVSWTSAGSGMVYDVYKSDLGCNAGFIKIGSGVGGLSLNDTEVVDGLSYSYLVIAHPFGNVSCSAAPSTCQSATPQTPPCNLTPPTGVTATVQGLNSILVSWNPVAGATGYTVSRATTSGGPYAEAGSTTAPVTTFTDTGLQEGTTYYYTVRAAATCESAASAEASATTFVCIPQTIYSNDFETGSGLADWTKGVFSGGAATSEWQGIQTCTAHSGSKVFRFGGSAACDANYSAGQYTFAQPMGASGVAIPAGVLGTRLSFWHREDFEFGYDGGTLALSLDGSNYTFIPASAILSGATYNAQVFNDCGPVGTPGRPVFTGHTTQFANTVVDLDAACNLASGTTDGCAGRTIRVAFVAVTDCVVQYSGWFLDDVTISACGPNCTAPGTPVIGSASTPADNTIQVTWTQGAPAASRFNVYRAAGSCAGAGTFTKRAQNLSSSPYLDTPVSGGSTFSYRVTGLDATGFCESAPSACVNATATGPCLLAPSFAGLDQASNTAQPTCGIQLSWPAASSNCSNSLKYNVYRSTSPAFLPSPANRIAVDLTGTTYTDSDALTNKTTYYYLVRAVDAINGAEEGNTVIQSAFPTGTIIPMTITETFEGAGGFDNPGWTHAALSGPTLTPPADWILSTTQVKSPTHSWLSPSQSSTADRVLVSPSFHVANGTTLSFWHTYEMEPFYDGGTLQMSLNGSTSWTVLPDSAFTAGGFDTTLFSTSNPIGGLRGWSGGTLGPMTQVTADLSTWAGSDMKLRWHGGEDNSIKYPGWYVDSVTIADAVTINSCQPAAVPPLDFNTVPPCRLLDTRNPVGPSGGPVLQPQTQRAFTAAGSCGIPVTARAVVLNVTVVQPAGPGFLTFFPPGLPPPVAATITFSTGQIRSNIATIPLGPGTGAFVVQNGSSGTLHLVVDVSGYYE